MPFFFLFEKNISEDSFRNLPLLQLEQDFNSFRRTESSISLVPQISTSYLVCCNDKIFACLFDYEESKEEKEGRKRNKTQSNQPKRNSDVTHINYLV